MTNSQPHIRKPTAKQLRYLKALAQKRGESFTYPSTAAQASAEIERLKKRKPMTVTDRRAEAHGFGRVATPNDAAAVRDSEITGYGSTAAWAQRR